MHVRNLILSAISAAVLSACTIGDPYGLMMMPTPYGNVVGHIHGDRHRVEQVALNAVTLDSGARLGLRVAKITDGTFNSEVRLRDSAELTVHMRTTPHALLAERQAGLVLRMSLTHAELVREDGQTQRYDLDLDTARPVIVNIVNDGRHMNITLGCTNLEAVPTSLPSTEWVVVEPSRRGRVELIDPTFIPLYDNQ